jgi:hypothetical protein
MGLRTLVDAGGTEWTVWDTVPEARRGLVQAGFERGWLTFQCESEKRRLAPIPPGWEVATDEALEDLLRSASPVAPRPVR